MRALAFLTVALGSTAALAGSAAVDREYTASQLQGIMQQLQLVQQQLDAIPSARGQLGVVQQQLTAARAQVEEVLRQVRTAPPVGPGVVVRPADRASGVLQPIGDATLRGMIQQINAAPFPDDKLRILQEAANGNWFLVDQVVRILPSFVHSSDRISALQALASQILDRANNFKVISAFTFSSDRERAQQILDSAPPLRVR
jgi:hypothetical protein